MAGVARKRSHSQLTTKTVLVYRNGDAYFPGKRFVVNPRQLATFDSFLNAVTHRVAAPFGAVRNVYTPREGHRVLSLDTLEHGEKYVAGGSERFKRVDYYNITTKKPQRKSMEMSCSDLSECVRQIQPVVHSSISVPARWRRITYESCTINVFTNGDILAPSVRILLPKYTLMSLERVLAIVTEKVHLRTGAVHKLCRLDGSPIISSRQLENSQYYVAVGTERFRRLPYFHWVPGKNVLQVGNLCDFLPPAPAPGNGKPRRVSFSDETSLKNSFFYAKPIKRTEEYYKQRTEYFKSRATLLSSGEGSVFRARQSCAETSGAEEVPEDTHVQVEVPVDQMEATEVEEEQCEMAEQSMCQSRTHSPVSKAPDETSSGGRATRLLVSKEHLPLPIIDSAHHISSPPTIDPAPSGPSD